MHLVHFTRTTIQTVTADRIIYLNDARLTGHIDFAQCCRNWGIFVTSGEEFPNTALSEAMHRCVAWRDAGASPPYTEFFTQPRTRFIFARPQTVFGRIAQFLSHDWYADFHELQLRVIGADWRTYDVG